MHRTQRLQFRSAIATLALAGAGQAFAGCGMPSGASRSPDNWHTTAAAATAPSSDSIVGLWKVSFVSDGGAYPGPIPAGVETDFGTVQWHPDGTEFMISGGRAPSTGDTCMGVWKQTGPGRYSLNHLALAWASGDTAPPIGPVSPSVFLGPAVFHETLTLGRNGNTYAGPFTIDQYAADGVTLLEHISGTVRATRMTAD